jgi:hypothetical protein
MNKKFDCVQMKRDIQKQMAEEFAGVPDDVAQQIMDERVAADPILGPFLKKVRVISLPYQQGYATQK